MKPERIILLRHVESEGNVDKTIYTRTPDWKVPITKAGEEQREKAYKAFRELIGDEAYMVYCSPWIRTRMTAQPFRKDAWKFYLDPRLREQEWGNFQRNFNEETRKERKTYGTFFYRFPDGESGADVFDRITTFFDTLHRDFMKKDFPNNALIVTHGLTLKIFLMRWFHWTPELFETIETPENGQLVVMELDEETDRYNITTELEMKDD